MRPGGYHGRFLLVDLADGRSRLQPLPAEILRTTLGGVGLGSWLLSRHSPAGIDPLAPQAAMVFAFSPLVGTPLTTSAKFAVLSKSPLTERLNDALSSSGFALAGKGCGIDALILTGSCRSLSALIIDGLGGRPRVRLEPAEDLAGLPAADAEARLRERLEGAGGPGWQTAAIGPAGEAGVRFATLSHDGRHAGRGGTGAVLGAKRIKAIAVRGDARAPLADAAAVVALARDLSARSFGPATAKYRELGTAANMLVFNRLAVLPTRNFQASTFAGAAELAPEALAEARGRTRKSCAACTIGCEHVYGLRGGGGVRVEYESLFALGPLLGLGDRDAVLEALRLCDQAGIDTISAGGTLAFALECIERGLLQPDPGTTPRFGDPESILDLLRAMAGRRAGLGDLLADGSRRAAAAIGGGAAAFAPHVKGLEIPGYEPRALHAMALGFAVSSRGADHNRSGAYEVDFSEGSDRMAGDGDAARAAVATEDRAALIDSLILCKFLRGVFDDLYGESAAMLAAVTGWDVCAAELRATARRIVAARRRFNEREGWTPAEDTLPDRFFDAPLTEGASAGARLTRERLAGMKAAYFAERGWSPEGRVPPDL